MKEKMKERYKIFKRDGGETVIHFNPVTVFTDADEVAKLSMQIYTESGGRIILACDLVEYGIITMHENLAMQPGLVGLNAEDSLKLVKNFLDLSAV